MDRGSYTGPGPYSSFSAGGMPCQRPPWGRLYAINANTGDIAWKVILGVNERLPKDKQTGRRHRRLGTNGHRRRPAVRSHQ